MTCYTKPESSIKPPKPILPPKVVEDETSKQEQTEAENSKFKKALYDIINSCSCADCDSSCEKWRFKKIACNALGVPNDCPAEEYKWVKGKYLLPGNLAYEYYTNWDSDSATASVTAYSDGVKAWIDKRPILIFETIEQAKEYVENALSEGVK